MYTIIEAKQLDEELKEFGAISRNWIVDLNLLSQDLDGFDEKHRQLTNFDVSSCTDYEVKGFFDLVAKLSGLINEVKATASNHMDLIASLLEDQDAEYNLSLIESHTRIEQEISSLLNAYNTVKQIAQTLFVGDKL